MGLSSAFNNVSVKAKFIAVIIVMMALTAGALVVYISMEKTKSTDKQLEGQLRGYADITSSIMHSHARLLSQETGIISKDRQLIGVLKCYVAVEGGTYDCAQEFLTDEIKLKFPEKPAAEIFAANPDVLKEFKAYMHKKLQENAASGLNQFKAANPDINKVSFYYDGKSVFRSFSEKYGDAVDRPLIAASAEAKKALGALGLDLGEIGWFQTIPIFNPGKYIIGEIGVPIDVILKEIQETTGVEHVSYVHADKKIYKTVSKAGAEPLDTAAVDVEGVVESIKRTKNVFFSVPVKDFSGKYAGKVVLVKDISAMLAEQYKATVVIAAVFLGITVVLVFALVRFFSVLFMRPLAIIAATVEDIAAGDLTARADYKLNDEFGRFADVVNRMAENLSDMIRGVKQAISSMSNAADNMRNSSEKVSGESMELSEKVTQIATATNEMSQTVDDISAESSRMAVSTTGTRTTAENGKRVVRKTIDEVCRIEENVTGLAGTMDSLGNRSKQIGEIVNVINDIADQTNLLALNAAIEAARAGEQGRGFAVVADEVRKLAEKTSKATTEITQMINAIQHETQNAIASMHKSIDSVHSGVGYSNEAGDALDGILKSIDELQGMVEHVASATMEMSSVAQQITQDTLDAAGRSRETSKCSDLATSATDRMVEFSIKLKATTDTFKVDDGGDVKRLR